MTALPDLPAPGGAPLGLNELRESVQGLLLHKEWAAAYGVEPDAVRAGEQNLRPAAGVLGRALEISAEPITAGRAPAERVVCICWHFAVVYTALLRAQGVAARVRCGFGGYFDPSKWYDHWITERWDGERWVRDDPQIDELQTEALGLDFDPHDQPPGRFLTGAEAWIAARRAEVDADAFGIADMWGMGFIAGNVVKDFACLNKVELLPWDSWGMITDPYHPLPKEHPAVLDEVSELATSDDFDSIRRRFESDDRLRVPRQITSYLDGEAVRVRVDDPSRAEGFQP